MSARIENSSRSSHRKYAKVYLAVMGYKQELRRHYSTIQVFAIAFSIMGLLPSIASTLSFSVPAGPAAMVWVLNPPPTQVIVSNTGLWGYG